MSKGLTQLFLASALVLLYAPLATAEIYKWVDDQGRVHFGDRPPEKQKVEKIEVDVVTYKHVSVEGVLPELLDPEPGSGGKPKVVMYSTEWCGVCVRAKRYFKKNNIAFTEYDIEKNKKAHRRFKKLGGNGVPLIRVGKKKMKGFNPARFEQLYESQISG